MSWMENEEQHGTDTSDGHEHRKGEGMLVPTFSREKEGERCLWLHLLVSIENLLYFSRLCVQFISSSWPKCEFKGDIQDSWELPTGSGSRPGFIDTYADHRLEVCESDSSWLNRLAYIVVQWLYLPFTCHCIDSRVFSWILNEQEIEKRR